MQLTVKNKRFIEINYYVYNAFRKEWVVFLAFLLVTLLLRSESFFHSVIDWDESLYLLMSKFLLNGHPPYSVVWDNKPPGIYLLFALSQIVFGNSILSIRIIGWIAVAISCYLLYRLGTAFGEGEKRIGVLAGLFYAIFSLNSQGLASNTEIFFTPFVILAFLLMVSRKSYPTAVFDPDSVRFFALGFIAGIGFEIKYVVIFDFLGILLILAGEIFCRYRHDFRSFLIRIISTCLSASLGFILPFLLVTGYFWTIGMFDEYVYANIVANTINRTDTVFSIFTFLKSLLQEAWSSSLLWLTTLLSPIYLIVFKDELTKEGRNILKLLVWFFMTLLGVNYTRLFYSHYFLQLLPSMSLLSAIIVFRVLEFTREMGVRKRFFLTSLVLIGPLSLNAIIPIGRGVVYSYNRVVRGNVGWGDKPVNVAKYLKERVKEDNYIYIVDYEPIVYYLVPANVPSKYVFPPFLTDEHFANVAGIEPIQELHRIMANDPVYIVKQYHFDDTFYDELDRYLKGKYFLENSIDGVELYRLRDG